MATITSPFMSVDTRAFNKFAKALRTADPLLANAMRARLRLAGNSVADEIRNETSYSKLIPDSVSVRTRGVSVSVIVGGAKAPDAVPIENRGKGNVRHPIPYSNQWTSKNSHAAFVKPAFDRGRDKAALDIAEVVESTIRMVAIAGSTF